jgi:short-subunit dehydrogenase
MMMWKKNETKSNIICAHPNESKRKGIKRIENTKKEVVMGAYSMLMLTCVMEIERKTDIM